MMVKRWNRKEGYRSGVAKFFTTLVILSSFFLRAASSPETGYFWQLTDIHWDQDYSTDGDPNAMCHSSPETRDLDPQEQPDSNVTASSSKIAGPYGTYRCDAPWNLVQLSIRGMVDNRGQPDFIIWTGDNTPHVKNPEPDWSVVFSSLRNVTTLLVEHFPNTTIIPVLGNHDVFPGDFYPGQPGGFYERYLTEGGWKDILSPAAAVLFERCGFYSKMVKPTLKVIVLNTNLYNIPDNLTHGDADPCSQFVWLEDELKHSEALGFKVLIAAHIPPGYFERWIGPPFYDSEKNERYLEILNRYGSTLLTHIYGHTHTDSFRILHDESSDEVKSVAFISPSVTPWLHEGGVNPSLRLYHYTVAQPARVLDYWQYFVNITEKDQPKTKRSLDEGPQWELLYRATAAYDIPDLGSDSLLNLYHRMANNDTVFQQYYYHNTVGNFFKECNSSCVRDHMCAVSHLRSYEMDSCQNGTNLLLSKMARMPPPVASSPAPPPVFPQSAYRPQLSSLNSQVVPAPQYPHPVGPQLSRSTDVTVLLVLVSILIVVVVSVPCILLLKKRQDSSLPFYHPTGVKYSSINQ